jgi:hypothetical protein
MYIPAMQSALTHPLPMRRLPTTGQLVPGDGKIEVASETEE